MADTPKGKGKEKEVPNSASEAWDAIAAFEQILEAMPNDFVALDALVHAYEMVGDHTRAREYLVRLARLLIEQGDIDSAVLLLDKIKQYIATDADAKAVYDQIEELGRGRKEAPGDEVAPQAKAEIKERAGAAPFKRTSNVADELSFAWHLLQSNLLSQEEYATVAQDLTEVSANEAKVTVSVLHVLHDRNFRSLESVIAFASKDSSTPIIALSLVDLQKDTVALMPLELMVQRGVVVFELLGPHALVAVLNPYNKKLREDVVASLKRKCHFFLTSPSDFDAAVSKAKALITGETGSATPPAKSK